MKEENLGIKEKEIITDFPYEVEVIEHQWLTLKDGTRLSYRIWLPKTDKALPTILEYIPYRKSDGTRTRDEPMHGYFAGHGYNVIRVDIRGSGESDGLLHDEYLLQEQDDALEVIDWISKQSWSNGKVGMMGKSWGGFNSLQVAARQPEALKAVISVGFTDDRYNEDIHYKGGCLLNDNFWWASIMLAYQVRPIDPKLYGDDWRDMWLERLDNMPHFQQNWLEHQVRDEYWQHGSVCEDYSAIKIPVLAIDGWEDSYKNTPLSLMEGLGEDVPKKAILGPWGHVYPHNGIPAPAMGFLQEAVKWWDRWLKDKNNDVMYGPMVDLWMLESMEPDSKYPVSKGRWVGVDSWPSNDVKEKSLELTSGLLLEKNTNDKERVLLNTSLNHGLLSGEWMGAGVLGESPADQRLDNGLAMTFDTDILEDNFEILGYPTVDLKLSSDKEQAMLYASIMDVAPDGAARRVSYGVMNLTHLEGHDKVVLLEAGKDVNVRVKLDAIAYNFPKGHKIRLALATSAWPMFWTMPEDATLDLDLKNAKLNLPLFTGKDSEGPNMEPESAAETAITILKEGKVDRTIEYDIVNDTWTCRIDGVGGVFGEGVYRFDDIDITVEHNLSNKLVLSNKDPLSAEYTIIQEMIIGREDWLIDADIFTKQTSDLDYFYLETKIDVKENGEHVFTKKWNEKVKRNGL